MSTTFTTLAAELDRVRLKIGQMENVDLLTCVSSQVRVKISLSRAKTCDVLLQFPNDYPDNLILMEIKSKTLPQKFTDHVVKVFDADPAKMVTGNGQVVNAVRFVLDFMRGNPLCVCTEEIASAKKLLDLGEGSADFLKVRQGKSQVHVRAESHAYRLDVRVVVPETYPDERVTVEFDDTTNFPDVFAAYFQANAAEVARRCLHPPTFKGKITQTQWQPRPSLLPVVEFLITNAKRYPTETCGLCSKRCFPVTPPSTSLFAAKTVKPPSKETAAQPVPKSRVSKKAVADELFDIERIYCGHIYHFECLDTFMKTPPFTGGKKCTKCANVIYHEKWKETSKVREERWAAFQARERELEEVADFIK